MTAETLGTIFAPICCLDRKAAASDVCDLVSETEPTVAFMIEHATRLFEVGNIGRCVYNVLFEQVNVLYVKSKRQRGVVQ